MTIPLPIHPVKTALWPIFFSRFPIHPLPSVETAIVNAINDDNNNDSSCPVDFQTIVNHQANDAILQQKLHTPGYKQLTVHNTSLIFFNKKICVLSSLIDRLIIWSHEILSHSGPHRTFNTISSYSYYQGMEARIKHIIKACSYQQ